MGKTTLATAMLFLYGATTRMGDVNAHTTVSDFDHYVEMPSNVQEQVVKSLAAAVPEK